MKKNSIEFKQVFYFGDLKTIKIAPKCKCCNRINRDTKQYKVILNKMTKYDILMKEAKKVGDNEGMQNAWEKFKLLAEIIEWDF